MEKNITFKINDFDDHVKLAHSAAKTTLVV